MKVWITLLALVVAGCATRQHLPDPARHWVRSDDYGEYHGLYVYSETPDGKLWWTHFPEKRPSRPDRPKHIGFWAEGTNSLRWTFLNHSNVAVYIQNTNGVYVEQDGGYYVPVELMPTPAPGGWLRFEE